eukprot:CAMPEP_0201595014 /NCGR_PEP_ID=MMETSP0190_2-20130828/192158_1 /ASSEMBLY_ACC=CAM_ASM_000263 /TAXON_ID=37353 /ORGANISM="Rosalina sp." /LENGTH=338 /DNA_ID=CAMNT_0048054857 /DNA_START=1049 /DNA_END=2062 /DNA_ORIENTATION=-
MTPSCDDTTDNEQEHENENGNDTKIHTAISLKIPHKTSSHSLNNELSLSPNNSTMTDLESEHDHENGNENESTPSIQNLEKINSITPSPKHIQILPDSELIPIKYNTIQIRLSPKKRMEIINDNPNQTAYGYDNREHSLPSLPSIPSRNEGGHHRFIGSRNYSFSGQNDHSRNNSYNLLSVNNYNMNNMSAIIGGDCKLSSIDTISVTNNTNGVFSELDDSILNDDYNDDLDNLLQDIHQIKFTEMDNEKDENQNENEIKNGSEKESGNESENEDLLDFVADFGDDEDDHNKTSKHNKLKIDSMQVNMSEITQMSIDTNSNILTNPVMNINENENENE